PAGGPPGQGECEHGNSGQECKPDPQPTHGQDCDEHGPFEGGVNEDHCLPPTTTEPPTNTGPPPPSPTRRTQAGHRPPPPTDPPTTTEPPTTTQQPPTTTSTTPSTPRCPPGMT